VSLQALLAPGAAHACEPLDAAQTLAAAR
jgi:hypothetical protein